MLQIKDICKEYKTGTLVQKALDHVSLNLRDNEFVAILGPSGSGKTTLLNIIGGLDRYDSGDLIINGISTKKYKDRDWDSYRNHTIGFVFQSYNLIPHQTILSNVELALTISGISRSQRRERALEALDQVGLLEQAHKKPNQMSGGQMQRVAIARALVNNPDILLADEPTGALDSDTSVQVMELLKEVAKDRLVVMVTHNPELAEQYATRIVRLKDGVIRDDSDPFVVAESLEEPKHKNLGKASMSFLTALSLSFNNLKTKKARTILVSFAGSIGIIGIALILSLSNGVNSYIHSVEEETLSEYPLAIQTQNFDLSSFFVRVEPEELEGVSEEENLVHERTMVNRMFSGLNTNDLKAFKFYIDNHWNQLDPYVNAIEYSYNITPEIYRYENDTYRQVNPDKSFESLGFGAGSSNSLQAMAMNTDVFHALPERKDLYETQYDVVAGRWPQKYNELVLVLFRDGSISDFTLYALGLKDHKELEKMVEQFSKEENVSLITTSKTFRYTDFLDIPFKLVPSSSYYRFDEEYNLWIDKSDDVDYMNQLVIHSEDLSIVGVVKPKEDGDIAMLQTGICYPHDLIKHVIESSQESEIVRNQQVSPTINVFTGKDFADVEVTQFNMDSLFKVNTGELQNAFSFDANLMNLDPAKYFTFDQGQMNMGDLITPESFSMEGMDMPTVDVANMLRQINVDVKIEHLPEVFENILTGYLDEAAKDPTTNYRNLSDSIGAYLETKEAQEKITKDFQEFLKQAGIEAITSEELTEAIRYALEKYPDYLIEQGITDPSEFNNHIGEYLQTEEGSARLTEAVNKIIAKYDSVTISEEQYQQLAGRIVEGYQEYAKQNEKPDLSKMQESFANYLQSEQGRKILEENVNKVIDVNDLSNQLNRVIASTGNQYAEALGSNISNLMQKLMGAITTKISNTMISSMESFMRDLSSSMQNAIHFDEGAFTRAFDMKMNEDDLRELMSSLMRTERDSYENNLRKLGYADLLKPSAITIYPIDFEGKEAVIKFIDDYNAQMQEVDEEKVISYSDTVGTLMSSVTTIIDTISYVLVAFVAISLVVSSIMIGVITYISVLERKKEIGILRAIGASKHNISQVFNAETFIIGLLAGVIGIIITNLLLIPGNQLIHTLSNNPNINAYLPIGPSIILIILSVILTLIGGIIPSRKASKSDPVTALRTE